MLGRNVGTRCGEPDSMELSYLNACAGPTKVVACLRRLDGTWLCDPDETFDDGLAVGAKKSDYTCHSSGDYHLYAMPLDAFLAGHCRYPKTVP